MSEISQGEFQVRSEGDIVLAQAGAKRGNSFGFRHHGRDSHCYSRLGIDPERLPVRRLRRYALADREQLRGCRP